MDNVSTQECQLAQTIDKRVCKFLGHTWTPREFPTQIRARGYGLPDFLLKIKCKKDSCVLEEAQPGGLLYKLATVSEAVVACSSIDAGITVWDLVSGLPISHLKSCASSRNSLACIGSHFVAASQINKSGSGAIFFWTWQKSQVAFKSYPVEPIEPLACTSDGIYLAGGGLSGRIYLWEVASGRLLRVWTGHYKAVRCLIFSDDDSLLISGADDGLVIVFPLVRVLDGEHLQAGNEVQVPCMHKWSDHTLPVTGLVAGSGGSSAIVVSCSLDHTCKIWSLGLGTLLRSILFPAALNSTALDPGEYALYAGGVDGRIFITALNFSVPATAGMHTADGLLGGDGVGHSRAVTSLAFCMDGVSLVSGSEDCTVLLWDTVTRQVLRTFTHTKGPISCVLVVPRPAMLQHGATTEGRPINRRGPLLPVVPLNKYVTAETGAQDAKPWEGSPVVLPSFVGETENDGYCYSSISMENQIKQLEQQGSTAAMQMELERLRSELRRALSNGQQWQQLHQELYCFCVDELMGGNKEREEEEKEPERDLEKEKYRGRGIVCEKIR